MCGLCSDDEQERKSAQDAYLAKAMKYKAVARLYENLADGRIKPHSDESSRGWWTPKMQSILRDIVNNWI